MLRKADQVINTLLLSRRTFNCGFIKPLNRYHCRLLASNTVYFGLLYSDQGKLKEAEEMYLRALAGYEKALGPGHPSTLNTVNNLGLLYSH
jgi:hypothetical protein